MVVLTVTLVEVQWLWFLFVFCKWLITFCYIPGCSTASRGVWNWALSKTIYSHKSSVEAATAQADTTGAPQAFHPRSHGPVGSSSPRCYCNSRKPSQKYRLSECALYTLVDSPIYSKKCFHSALDLYCELLTNLRVTVLLRVMHIGAQILNLIHIFKVSFLTKFTFSKPNFSQNSHFSNIKFFVISG